MLSIINLLESPKEPGKSPFPGVSAAVAAAAAVKMKFSTWMTDVDPREDESLLSINKETAKHLGMLLGIVSFPSPPPLQPL